MSEQDDTIKGASGAVGDESGTHDDNLETTDDSDASGDDSGKSVSRSTYKKTLGEAKKYKAELRKAREERASIEERLLAAEGNKDEQIKALQSKLAVEQKKAKDLYGNMARRALTEQVASAAEKAGCIDPDAVMALADLSELEIDSDSFKADADEVSSMIAGLKKAKPYLFNKPAPKVNTKMPNGQMADADEKEDLSKLSMEQLKAKLKTIK